MGQYYKIVNLDKGQYLHPHALGDGLKLLEFACSAPGTMTALAILLADSNGRGGGDLMGPYDPKTGRTLDVPDPYGLIGSWAGDRIVVTGDYGDHGKLYGVCPDDDPPRDDRGREWNMYHYASEVFCDISEAVKELICQDSYVKSEMGDAWSEKVGFDTDHKFAPRAQAPDPTPEPAPDPEDPEPPAAPDPTPPEPPTTGGDPDLDGF